MRKLRRVLAALLLLALVLVSAPVRGFADAPDSDRYPIIFIPGIAGSELYNRNELVWINTWRAAGSHIPMLNLFQMQWLLPLRLAADGKSPYRPDYQVRAGDVMRHGMTDVYSGLIETFRDMGYEEGKTLRLLPYDWRLDPTMAADQLGRLVDRTLTETGASKVVLVGHSLGGLIARDYVVRGGAAKVKATISLATPWLGAPVAYRALEYGWDMGIKLPGTKWAALAPGDVRLLVQNYPSVYALSPARGYFDWYPDGYLARGGHTLNYDASLAQGLATHNRTLAMAAPAYQERLLNGRDYGVKQFVMAGSGRSTLGRIAESRTWLGLPTKTERMTDGDEVVPLHSADLGYSRDPARAERYIGRLEAVSYANQPHTFFTQSRAVQDQVEGWINQVNGR